MTYNVWRRGHELEPLWANAGGLAEAQRTLFPPKQEILDFVDEARAAIKHENENQRGCLERMNQEKTMGDEREIDLHDLYAKLDCDVLQLASDEVFAAGNRARASFERVR